MQDQGRRFYRVREVAKMYDVSVATIYRAIENGQLHALKIGTGKGALRIPGSALAAFEEACSSAAYTAHVLGNVPAAEADRDELGEVA